jgi:hypothetical protein
MAYPTVDASYGFKPVNLIGGRVFSGSTRTMQIGSGHGTAIFYGDIVSLSAAGTIWGTGPISTTAPVQVAGIFLGCSYINTQGQRVYSQYYPASTTGTPDTANAIQAYVADDPDMIMKATVATAASATGVNIGRVGRDAVGATVAFFNNVGSTVTGNSLLSLNTTVGTATTLPFRIIDVVPETSTVAGSFSEVLVMFTPGVHMYRGAAGI